MTLKHGAYSPGSFQLCPIVSPQAALTLNSYMGYSYNDFKLCDPTKLRVCLSFSAMMGGKSTGFVKIIKDTQQLFSTHTLPSHQGHEV